MSISYTHLDVYKRQGNPIGDSRRSLGLGLTLCQAIIHAHNGEMTLKDNLPHGCIFSFTVPLSEVNLNE